MSESGGWVTPDAPGPGGGWGAPPGAAPSLPGAPAAPVRPGIVPLRPLGLGELYDGAFQAVRTSAGPLLGWAAAVVVVLVAVQTAVSATAFRGVTRALTLLADGRSTAPGDALRQLSASSSASPLLLVLSQLVSLVASSVLTGVVIVSVSTAVLGRRTSAGALWRRVRPRLAALVGVAVLMALVLSAVLVVCLLPGAVVLALGALSHGTAALAVGVALLVLGLVAGLLLVLVVDTRLLLAPAALVLEPQRVGASLRRAWALSRRGFWRLLGIHLLTVVAVGVATEVISAPFAGVAHVISDVLGGDRGLVLGLAVSAVGQALALTVFYPFSAAVTALLYVDQRMRFEGLDVELATAASTPA